jgi:transcriptional regulator with XRE-family HTH domain
MSFRELRVRAGLSVAQVMSALNVSDAAVYMWESGATTPNAKRLSQIAKLYNCTVDELLTDNAQA